MRGTHGFWESTRREQADRAELARSGDQENRRQKRMAGERATWNEARRQTEANGLKKVLRQLVLATARFGIVCADLPATARERRARLPRQSAPIYTQR